MHILVHCNGFADFIVILQEYVLAYEEGPYLGNFLLKVWNSITKY